MESTIPTGTVCSSAFAPVSAKPTGIPASVQSRCRPRNHRECEAQNPVSANPATWERARARGSVRIRRAWNQQSSPSARYPPAGIRPGDAAACHIPAARECAQLAAFRDETQHSSHHRNSDQLRIGDSRLQANRRPPGGQRRLSVQRVLGRGKQCCCKGVQVVVHQNRPSSKLGSTPRFWKPLPVRSTGPWSQSPRRDCEMRRYVHAHDHSIKCASYEGSVNANA
jgi:hypothetical protein